VLSVNLSDLITDDKNINIISAYIANTLTNNIIEPHNIVTNCTNLQNITLTIPSSVYNQINPNLIRINIKTQPNLINYHITGTFIKNSYTYSV